MRELRFKAAEVGLHLDEYHKHLPRHVRKAVLWRVIRRSWRPNTRLGAAVGMCLQNYVRHKLTPYEALLEQDCDRDEALRRIAPEMGTIIAKLSDPPAPILGVLAADEG